MTEEVEKGTLTEGEVHPASSIALDYIGSFSLADWAAKVEAIASCALSGNRLAEVVFETLRRLHANEPVSDRYLMGAAWLIWQLEKDKK